MSGPLLCSEQWRWNAPGLVWNGVAPNQNPVMPTTSSTDTSLVVNLTAAQKAAIIAKVGELAALLT